MTYCEQKRNLFVVDSSYHLAHCIASDLGMSAGIAVGMQKEFGLRGKILKSGESLKHPTCILTGRVFNLITKARSGGKPTYPSLGAALDRMRDIVVRENVPRIAMPKIGCGLDRLQWPLVREMIRDRFGDLDIEILVCSWK